MYKLLIGLLGMDLYLDPLREWMQVQDPYPISLGYDLGSKPSHSGWIWIGL